MLHSLAHLASLDPSQDIYDSSEVEKTLESLVDSKEIKPVNPKGNQTLIFTGRTGIEAEAPILCYFMKRANLLAKTLMLGKIVGGRRRGQHNEMV